MWYCGNGHSGKLRKMTRNEVYALIPLFLIILLCFVSNENAKTNFSNKTLMVKYNVTYRLHVSTGKSKVVIFVLGLWWWCSLSIYIYIFRNIQRVLSLKIIIIKKLEIIQFSSFQYFVKTNIRKRFSELYLHLPFFFNIQIVLYHDLW